MKRFCQGVTIAIAGLCAIGFAVISARAAELKTAAEIMEFSSGKMAAYKTWSADYSQSVNLLGNGDAITGQIAQKLPRQMWMQLDMPMIGHSGRMTMVLGQDGIMWQVMDIASRIQILKADMNRVTSNLLTATGVKFDPLNQMDPSKQWDMSKKQYDFKVVAAKESDGPRVYVLEGLAKAGALTNQAAATKMGRMRVAIGKDDGFVHRMEVYDKSLTNLVTGMEFKNLKFNEDIPDSKFTYEPPAGQQVSDITTMFEMRMRANDGDSAPPPPKPVPPAAPKTP